MKSIAMGMAAVVVAIGGLAWLTRPSPRLSLAASSDRTVRGNLHVHSTRSDGRGTPDEVAAAAARAGLAFIVLTDHGDATRVPDPPTYRSGVLCLDGVEISTSDGHYLAFDLPASPYPLGGEARDVIEDVRRLGGFGVAAHPDSPKAELRWRDWTAPFDGVEWMNADSSWRVYATTSWASRLQLASAFLYYPARPAETLAALLTISDDTIARWNGIARERRVGIFAGVDAHARLALRNTDPVDRRFSVSLPSYEASFESLAVHVALERPFSGDASSDAAMLMRALRVGHFYTAVEGVATPPSLDFSATNARGTVHPGDELGVGGAVSLHVRSNAPPGFTTVIWQGARVLAMDARNDVTVEAGSDPAVYRVEVRSNQAGRTPPWLLSNAIYVRAPAPQRAPGHELATTSTPVFDAGSADGWHVESDAATTAALDVAEGASASQLRLRYSLSSAAAANAAFVWGRPAGRVPAIVAGADRFAFTARADRPMRISVQLRAADRTLRRWQRSVYVDQFDRDRTVYFDDFAPTPGTSPQKAPLSEIGELLLVVDTTNTAPGSSGRIWITRAAVAH